MPLGLEERREERRIPSSRIPSSGGGGTTRSLRAARPLGIERNTLHRQSFSSDASTIVGPEASPEQPQKSEASSIENDLVRAELAGLSGNDDAYEALMSELSMALEHLDQVAHGGDENALVDALQSAGKCYWSLGMLDESRELYEDALTRLINIHTHDSSTDGQPPDHPAIASTLHTLGSIHARSGSPTEATKWYESALAMKKRVYGKRTFHPEIGKTLNGLAMLKVHASDDGSEATHSHGMDEDWEQAMRLFEEAERNYRYFGLDRGDGGRTGSIKAADGPNEGMHRNDDYSDHPDVASICENMALLHRRSGDHQAAFVRYKEALRIRTAGTQDSSDNDTSEVDNVTLGLKLSVADCLRAMSKWDEAAEIYEKALADHMKVETADTNSRKEDRNDGGSWLPFARKSELSEDNDEEGTGTALESVIRHNLGLIHAEMGRFDQALAEYDTSRRIKIALAGDTHPEVASTLNAIGALYGAKGESERALAHFREALYIYRLHSAELGEDDPDVVNTQRNIRLIEKSGLKTGKEDRLTMM